MKPAFIEGMALWSPGYPNLQSFLSGKRDDNSLVPTCYSVNRRHLRYTSQITRMSLSVFEQACADHEDWKKDLGVVFASSMGEIQIAETILRGIEEEGAPSPASFMNSVHNAGIGHLSIACKNQRVSTAIAAGPQTVSAALTEAMLLLQSTSAVVALIVADEALPQDFTSSYPSLAACLLLRASPTGDTLGRLSGLALNPGGQRSEPGLFGDNPVAPMIPLLQAIAGQKEGTCPLDGKNGEGWVIDFSRPGEAS